MPSFLWWLRSVVGPSQQVEMTVKSFCLREKIGLRGSILVSKMPFLGAGGLEV